MARTIPNTARAKGTNTNEAADTFLLRAEDQIGNLVLRKTGPSSVIVGQNFDYTIVVTNNDPAETAFSVAFIDNAPNGVIFTAASSTAGTVTVSLGGTGVTGNLGDILPGGSVTVTITAHVTP